VCVHTGIVIRPNDICIGSVNAYMPVSQCLQMEIWISIWRFWFKSFSSMPRDWLFLICPSFNYLLLITADFISKKYDFHYGKGCFLKWCSDVLYTLYSSFFFGIANLWEAKLLGIVTCFCFINWWKGKPSGSIACAIKQQPRFYWSRSSVVMNDATPLTPPSAWAELYF